MTTIGRTVNEQGILQIQLEKNGDFHQLSFHMFLATSNLYNMLCSVAFAEQQFFCLCYVYRYRKKINGFKKKTQLTAWSAEIDSKLRSLNDFLK